jgi:hypothetical protein
MSKRGNYRSLYAEGWQKLDVEMLLLAVADDFQMDDPALPDPVTKSTLQEYIASLRQELEALGTTTEFEISDSVEQDKDGVLLDWNWWKYPGTDLQGSAVIKTTDEGVVYERMAYYIAP